MEKFFYGLVIVCALGIFAVAVLNDNGKSQAKAQQKETFKQREVNAIVHGIEYIKDTRTNPNICFAYLNGESSASLATVPCDAIPAQMLQTAR